MWYLADAFTHVVNHSRASAETDAGDAGAFRGTVPEVGAGGEGEQDLSLHIHHYSNNSSTPLFVIINRFYRDRFPNA